MVEMVVDVCINGRETQISDASGGGSLFLNDKACFSVFITKVVYFPFHGFGFNSCSSPSLLLVSLQHWGCF